MCGNALNSISNAVGNVLGGVGHAVESVMGTAEHGLEAMNSDQSQEVVGIAAKTIVGGAVLYGGAIAAGAAGGAGAGAGATTTGATATAAGEGFAAGVAGEAAGAGATAATGSGAITSATVLGGLRTAAQVAASVKNLSNALSPAPAPARPGPAYNGVLPVQYVPAQASGIAGRAGDPSPVLVAGGAGNSGPDAAELIALAVAVGGIYFALH